MNREKITNKLHKSYEKMISREGYLFEIDTNERSLTHKLAEYLQLEFPEWNVDCEYNRNEVDTKKLDSFKRNISSDDTNAVSVYPDIIIHHRGTKNNLIVIEAKKTSSTVEDLDEKKLKAYKNDLGYKFAFKITFPVKEQFKEIKELDKYIKEVNDE
ncbi:MAG: hypothetical protein J7L46_06335 [Bacteroidales bacterium]|nr:hypothetical protein [Bacteroidales bacterium]